MGHGNGCFPSGHKKNGRDMYDHRTYQGRVDDGYVVPAYATYDDALPQVCGASKGVPCRMHAKPSAGGLIFLKGRDLDRETQELLDNISSLGVDAAVHFDGRTRAPSINRAGRMPSTDGTGGGWVPNHHPMMDLHRAMSVKGGQLLFRSWDARQTCNAQVPMACKYMHISVEASVMAVFCAASAGHAAAVDSIPHAAGARARTGQGLRFAILRKPSQTFSIATIGLRHMLAYCRALPPRHCVVCCLPDRAMQFLDLALLSTGQFAPSATGRERHPAPGRAAEPPAPGHVGDGWRWQLPGMADHSRTTTVFLVMIHCRHAHAFVSCGSAACMALLEALCAEIEILCCCSSGPSATRCTARSGTTAWCVTPWCGTWRPTRPSSSHTWARTGA